MIMAEPQRSDVHLFSSDMNGKLRCHLSENRAPLVTMRKGHSLLEATDSAASIPSITLSSYVVSYVTYVTPR
jgi:hypothetical protein